ncbi:hypothetical protein QBC47DRAFT_333452 [Echria macrotheca]|uniref:NACHT domain-containing protein n=1 Tax=Echria macrotheca TaxID=438768 RepID=A0AAJ0B0R4_9PEZI|nr:hypothetical protein QBC47DRAFT_333452 [Echria macrotheca]
MSRPSQEGQGGAASEADAASQAGQEGPSGDADAVPRSDVVSGIFKEAIGSFMASLPAADRDNFTQYNDAQSMMSSITSIAEAHPIHGSRLTAACRKFQVFVDHIKSYFDVVEIFVQVKPEYLALIWGSLRLIFKLSTNYINFLERMAEMFADIAAHLPAYEEFVVVLQTRAAARNASYPRLTKALGLVYLDIVRFCHSAYMLFGNKERSIRVKLSLVGRLLWKPFDVQYDSLLLRLGQHKKIFELEVSLASTVEAARILDRLEENLKDAERSLLSNGKQDPRQEKAEKGQEAERRANRVKILKEWVQSSRWTERLEQARGNRESRTGTWILSNETYANWRGISAAPGKSLGSRTLTIQGKPGYGKTVLSSVIIEDLGAYAIDANCIATHSGRSVVFYHFDRRRGDANTPSDALRAMLTQLLHLHRLNERAIDVASVIFRRSDTGETRATNDEVMAVLEVLLDQLKFTYLVFDGLDECSDPGGLFRKLEAVASRSVTSAVLFLGRPTVQLPARMAKECFAIDLEKEHPQHIDDMKQALRPQLEELAEEDLFPEELDFDETIEEITARANGMFLWVRLLAEYLKLPSLTARDRVHAIKNLARLEGLDQMYAAIFETLEVQFPGASLATVSKLFQFVAYSHRTLQIAELHHAISVPLDRAQTKSDIIPRFTKSIGSLSGSLIELSRDGTVQFIHLSAQEYFVSTSRGQQTSHRKLLTNEEQAHRSIAATCLSYLCHTVPHRPLGGSSQTIPSAVLVSLKYPLLKYSAESWGRHLAGAFKHLLGKQVSQTAGDVSWQELAALLRCFLESAETTTLWIEASFLYGLEPAVPSLPDFESVIKPLFEPQSTALDLLRSSIDDLQEFSRDLTALIQSWSYILSQEPNEMWEPSVPVFTESRFWLSTTKARKRGLEASSVTQTTPAEDFIIVRSRLSHCGTEMGVVKLLPPRKWINELDKPDEKQSHAKHEGNDNDTWRARYDLWSLQTDTIIHTLELQLGNELPSPVESLSEMKSRRRRKYRRLDEDLDEEDIEDFSHRARISLPLDISEDLRRLVILNNAVVIRPNVEAEIPTYFSQVLDLSTEATESIRHQEVILFSREFESFSAGYHIILSPSGKYMAVVHESLWEADKDGTGYPVLWLLQILVDQNFDSSAGGSGDCPEYALVAATRLFSVPEVSLLSPIRGIAFHPHAPRLAFPQVVNGLPQTYIWDFEEPITLPADDTIDKPLNPFPLHDPPIIDPAFSDPDGEYLYGTDAPFEFGAGAISRQNLRGFGKPLIVKVPHERVRARSSYPDPKAQDKGKGKETTVVSSIQTNPSQGLRSMRAAAMELAARPKPPVQRANVLSFDKDGKGVAHISQLQQLDSEGAVVLNTLGTDGHLKSETLSRLPAEMAACASVSFIHSGPGVRAGSARIVIDKAARRSYGRADLNKSALPAIVERERDSIPSFVTKVDLALEMEPHGSATRALVERGKGSSDRAHATQ